MEHGTRNTNILEEGQTERERLANVTLRPVQCAQPEQYPPLRKSKMTVSLMHSSSASEAGILGSQDYNFFQLHLETGKAAVVLRVAKRLDGWKVMTLHSHRFGYTQKAFTRMFLFRVNRIVSDVFPLPSQEVATWTTSFWTVLARNASFTFEMNGQGKTEIELEYRSSGGADVSLCRGSYEEGSWVLDGAELRAKVWGFAERFH
jgi:hypothetical protein